MNRFRSDLAGSIIIDDTNFQQFAGDGSVRGHAMSRGYTPRDYVSNPFGSYAQPFSNRDLIPRDQWAERIEEQERNGATLAHLHDHYKLPILDQNGYGYCWCYGTVKAAMLARAVAGLPTVYLSASSLAAKIKNYRNEGGWAGQAVQGWKKYGCSTIEFWPEADVDPKYDTPAQRENAKRHSLLEWTELPEQSFDALVTSLLLGMPTTMALMWWGHLVCGLRPVVLGRNDFGVEIVNSWRESWGNGGKAVLRESKATPHEAIAVRSVSASR